VPGDELHRALARFGQCSQSARRGNELAEMELGFGDFNHFFPLSSLLQNVRQATKDGEGDQTQDDQEANDDLFEDWVHAPAMYN
jgi:hypothetical protein